MWTIRAAETMEQLITDRRPEEPGHLMFPVKPSMPIESTSSKTVYYNASNCKLYQQRADGRPLHECYGVTKGSMTPDGLEIVHGSTNARTNAGMKHKPPYASVKVDGYRAQFVAHVNFDKKEIRVRGQFKKMVVPKETVQAVFSDLFSKYTLWEINDPRGFSVPTGQMQIVMDGELFSKKAETCPIKYATHASNFPPEDRSKCTDFMLWSTKICNVRTKAYYDMWQRARFATKDDGHLLKNPYRILIDATNSNLEAVDWVVYYKGLEGTGAGKVEFKGNKLQKYVGQTKAANDKECTAKLADYKSKGKEWPVLSRWRSVPYCTNVLRTVQPQMRLKAQKAGASKQTKDRYRHVHNEFSRSRFYILQEDYWKTVKFGAYDLFNFITKKLVSNVKWPKYIDLRELSEGSLIDVCKEEFAERSPERHPEGLIIHPYYRHEDYFDDFLLPFKVKPMYTKCTVIVSYLSVKGLRNGQQNANGVARMEDKWRIFIVLPNNPKKCFVATTASFRPNGTLITKKYIEDAVKDKDNFMHLTNCTVKGYVRNPVSFEVTDDTVAIKVSSAYLQTSATFMEISPHQLTMMRHKFTEKKFGKTAAELEFDYLQSKDLTYAYPRLDNLKDDGDDDEDGGMADSDADTDEDGGMTEHEIRQVVYRVKSDRIADAMMADGSDADEAAGSAADKSDGDRIADAMMAEGSDADEADGSDADKSDGDRIADAMMAEGSDADEAEGSDADEADGAFGVPFDLYESDGSDADTDASFTDRCVHARLP